MQTIHRALLAATVLALAASASAQTFPTRPVRIIVPFPAGGPSDILTRMMGPKLADLWGQQVVVDNRPDAGRRCALGLGRSDPQGGTETRYRHDGGIQAHAHQREINRL